MLEAGLWGLLAASSLVIGAAFGAKVPLEGRWVALMLGFGAGALISALAFELTEEAFALGGADAVAAGLAAGAFAYYLGSRAIGHDEGKKLMLGATLDGIPETAVLGITLLEGEISAALLAAVFISNLPEAAAGADLSPQKRGRERGPMVLAQWAFVAILSAIAAALGYGLLDGASDDLVGFILAFAGGAVLMTLGTTMFPDAHEQAARGRAKPGEDPSRPMDPTLVGLASVLGFVLTYLLSQAG